MNATIHPISNPPLTQSSTPPNAQESHDTLSRARQVFTVQPPITCLPACLPGRKHTLFHTLESEQKLRCTSTGNLTRICAWGGGVVLAGRGRGGREGINGKFGGMRWRLSEVGCWGWMVLDDW